MSDAQKSARFTLEVESRDELQHLLIHLFSFCIVGFFGVWLCYQGGINIARGNRSIEPFVLIFFGFPITLLCLWTGLVGLLDWRVCGLRSTCCCGFEARGNSLWAWETVVSARFADFVEGHSKARYYSIAVWVCILAVLEWQYTINDMGEVHLAEWQNVSDPLLHEWVTVECDDFVSAGKACVNMSSDTSFVTKVVPVPAPYECRVTVRVRERFIADPEDYESLDWFSYLFHGLDWIPEKLGATNYVNRDPRLSTNVNHTYTGNLLTPKKPKVVKVAMINDAYFTADGELVNLTAADGKNLSAAGMTNGSMWRSASLAETEESGVATFTSASLLYKLAVDEGVSNERYRFAFQTVASNTVYSSPFQVLNEVISIQNSLAHDSVKLWSEEVKAEVQASHNSVGEDFTAVMRVNVSQWIPTFNVKVGTRELANRHRLNCDQLWDSKFSFANRKCAAMCVTCRTQTASCKSPSFTCTDGEPVCNTDCVKDLNSDDLNCLQRPLDITGAPHHDLSRTVTIRAWLLNETTQMYERADAASPVVWGLGMVMKHGVALESSSASFFSDVNGSTDINMHFSSAALTGTYRIQAVSQGVASDLDGSPEIFVFNPLYAIPEICIEAAGLSDYVDSSGIAFLKSAAWLLFAIACPAIYGNREEINAKILWYGDQLNELAPAPVLLIIINVTTVGLLILSVLMLSYVGAFWSQANDCKGFTVYQASASLLLIVSFSSVFFFLLWGKNIAKRTPSHGRVPETYNFMGCFHIPVERCYASISYEKRAFYVVKLMLADLKLLEMNSVNMKKPSAGTFIRFTELMKKLIGWHVCLKRLCLGKGQANLHPSDDFDKRAAKEIAAFRKKTQHQFMFSSRFLLTFYASIFLILSFHVYALSSIDHGSNQIDVWFYEFHNHLNTIQSNISTFVEMGAAMDLKNRLHEQSYGGAAESNRISPSFQRLCRGSCTTISRMGTANMIANCVSSSGLQQSMGCAGTSAWFFDMYGILNYSSRVDPPPMPELQTATDDEERNRQSTRSYEHAAKNLPGFDEVEEVHSYQYRFQTFVNDLFNERNKDQLNADLRQCLFFGAWCALAWIFKQWLGADGMFIVYRKNVLKMRRGQHLRELPKVNFSLAAQFVGFQIMHFIIGYWIVFITMSVTLFLCTSKLTSEWFIYAVLSQILVAMSLSFIMKVIVAKLNNSFLLGKTPRGKVPFIKERLAFEKTDIILMMFSIVTGAGMAAYRIFHLITMTFSGFIRLDRCLLEGTKESSDFGYSAYVAMVTMDHFFNNPVRSIFMKCVELVSKRATLVENATEGMIAQLTLSLPKDKSIACCTCAQRCGAGCACGAQAGQPCKKQSKKCYCSIEGIFDGLDASLFKPEHHFNENNELIPHQDDNLLNFKEDEMGFTVNQSVTKQRKFRKCVVRSVINHTIRQASQTAIKQPNQWANVWRLVKHCMLKEKSPPSGIVDHKSGKRRRSITDTEVKQTLHKWKELWEDVCANKDGQTSQAHNCSVGPYSCFLSCCGRDEDNVDEDSVPADNMHWCSCKEGYNGIKPYDCERCGHAYELHREFEGGEVKKLLRSQAWLPLTYYQHNLRWWLTVYLDKMPELPEMRRHTRRDEEITHSGQCHIVENHRWVDSSCWLENDMLYYQATSVTDLGSHMATPINLADVAKAPGSALFPFIPDLQASEEENIANQSVNLIACTTLDDDGERVAGQCSVRWQGKVISVIWMVQPCEPDGGLLREDYDAEILSVEQAATGGIPKVGGRIVISLFGTRPQSFVFLNPVDWHSAPTPMIQEMRNTDPEVKKATQWRSSLACFSTAKPVAAEPELQKDETETANLQRPHRPSRTSLSAISTLLVAPGKHCLSLKTKTTGEFFMSFDTVEERSAMKQKIADSWAQIKKSHGNCFWPIDQGHNGRFVGGSNGRMLRYQHWEMVFASAVEFDRAETSVADFSAHDCFLKFPHSTRAEIESERTKGGGTADKDDKATHGIIKDVRYTLTELIYTDRAASKVVVKLEPCRKSWMTSGSTNFEDMDAASAVFMIAGAHF